MFSKGRLYKHEDNTTVAFEVVKSLYIEEKKRWSLRVAWYNVGKCHEPWDMGISQRIEIEDKDVSKWKPMPFDGRISLPPPRFIGEAICE